MRNKSFMILGLITLFILAGCADGTDNSGTLSAFVGGSQGIVAEFEPFGITEDGVNTVWVGESFPIEMTVRNKGEEDIEAGDLKITLKGIDTALFGITDSDLDSQTDLEKVSELNNRGGEETLVFEDGMLDDLTGTFYDANVFASVEYLYRTFVAVPKVCFKEDFQDDSLCDLQGDKDVFSSGAPIVVNLVTQEQGGAGSIALIFEVENVGGGDVTTYDMADTFDQRYDKFNFELTEGESQDITWDCSSAGSPDTGRFNEGKALIRCKSNKLPEGTLFTKQMTLTLSYKYKDVVEQTVRIKNNPQ